MLCTLVWAIVRWGRPMCVLVQSPPALPVLPVLLLLRRVCGLKVVVDVHNLGYTLMRSSSASGDKAAVSSSDRLPVRATQPAPCQSMFAKWSVLIK